MEMEEGERKRVALGECISRGEELAGYLMRRNEVHAASFVGLSDLNSCACSRCGASLRNGVII